MQWLFPNEKLGKNLCCHQLNIYEIEVYLEKKLKSLI